MANCECCTLTDCTCDVYQVQKIARSEALLDALEVARKMNSTHDIISALEDMLYENDIR